MFRSIKYILPILIILIAVFLRFYRLSEFATFLGDQGRDAIILKRIITFEHFPAIGPPSSLGQIYLGPFYYYLIAPFLLLFNFNPAGPAYGIALISSLGIILSYFLLKKETNWLTALLFLIFTAVSFVNIQQSRFSWNPNLLPVFSFLTLYFYNRIRFDKTYASAFLFGAFLSFSIQLHYLALLLFLPTIFTSIQILSKEKLKWKFIKKHIIADIAFVFFTSPLIIFDLRHQYLNSKNFIKLFIEGNPTDHEGFIGKFIQTNQSFYNHVFVYNINPYLAALVSIILCVILFRKFSSNKYSFLQINLITFISYLLIFSIFNTTRNVHYFNSIYFSFFIILAFLLSNLFKNKAVRIVIASFVIGFYMLFNTKNLTYLFGKGGNQIKKAETIADSILQRNPHQPFQTIALPYVETDGHIRYFLEIKGKRALPADTLEEPKELYVLCFEKCQVLGNPQWQIAAFKNAKIDRIWTVEGVTIYRIIHGQ